MVSTSPQPQTHPWRRYFARTIDNVLVSLISLPTFFVIAFIISMLLTLGGIHAEGTEATIAKLILKTLYLGIVCFWMIVIEAALLSTWGTTPGKRLLGLWVTSADGNLLDWQHALKRSIQINTTLFGLGWIPALGLIFTIVFMLIQRRKLLTSGYTSWDQANQIMVTLIKENAA